MTDHPDQEIEIRHLSVRLHRRGLKLPFWLFRPVCWIIRHQWWKVPKGLPYPTMYKNDEGDIVLDPFTHVKACLRCHKTRTVKERQRLSPAICDVCDEESTCDYVKDYDHPRCCTCDDDIEGQHKYCASCFSGYASDIHDYYKGELEDRM